MKAGNIPPEVFKQWQYQATAMRDGCGEGDAEIEEFEEWMQKSFHNRKHYGILADTCSIHL